MAEEEEFWLEKVMRVAYSHVAHRADPPTMFEPWTQRRRGVPGYREVLGHKITNQQTREVTHCYAIPDYTAPTPQLNIHQGKAGNPDKDPIVATIPITWDG